MGLRKAKVVNFRYPYQKEMEQLDRDYLELLRKRLQQEKKLFTFYEQEYLKTLDEIDKIKARWNW